MEDGVNFLYIFCEKGYDKIVMILFEICNGKNVNLSRLDGVILFYLVCLKGCYSMMYILLDYGVVIYLCMNNGVILLYIVC